MRYYFLKKTRITMKLYCIMRNSITKILEYYFYYYFVYIVLFNISNFTFTKPRNFLMRQYKFYGLSKRRLLFSLALPTFFEKPTKWDKTFSIHTRNLQTLGTKMFKVYQKISSTIFGKIFLRWDINCNLRSNPQFAVPIVSSVFRGSEIIFSLEPRMFYTVYLELREFTNIEVSRKVWNSGC